MSERTEAWWLARVDREGEQAVGAGGPMIAPDPTTPAPRPGVEAGALAPNERVVRHPNGHLMIERVPPYIPTEAAIDKALASLSKAYPYLVEHASHIDGEFGNALTEVRRMVAAFRSALAAPPAPAPAGEECGERNGQWVCTLPAGHGGCHEDRHPSGGCVGWAPTAPAPAAGAAGEEETRKQLAIATANVQHLWDVIRQKECDAYAAANALDVAELDARCCNLVLEKAELERRLRDAPEAADARGGDDTARLDFVLHYAGSDLGPIYHLLNRADIDDAMQYEARRAAGEGRADG